jgi:hypothetical protein
LHIGDALSRIFCMGGRGYPTKGDLIFRELDAWEGARLISTAGSGRGLGRVWTPGVGQNGQELTCQEFKKPAGGRQVGRRPTTTDDGRISVANRFTRTHPRFESREDETVVQNGETFAADNAAAESFRHFSGRPRFLHCRCGKCLTTLARGLKYRSIRMCPEGSGDAL